MMCLLLIVVLATNCQTIFTEQEIGLSAANVADGRRLYEIDKDKPLTLNLSTDRQIFDDDVRFSVEELQSMRESKGEAINAIVRLWTDGVVPYAISNELQHPDVIAEAIEFFHAETCLCWVPRSNESDYVLFTPNGVGCSSNVGFQANGKQTVILADTDCVSEVGNILHLMLHVVGLHHEHQRINRDQWINVNLTNIIDGQLDQFHKVATNLTAIDDNRYDYESLTHYGKFDRAVDRLSPSIEPKARGVGMMGQRTRLSEGDIEKLHLLYGNNCQKNLCQPTTIDRCILLIGGQDLGSVPLLEYYHPTEEECDMNAIGRMPTSRISNTQFTSGCYLSDTQQIVIRETSNPEKPPMIYGLSDLSANPLPPPYKDSTDSPAYTYGSTAASIDPSVCISCGGRNTSNSELNKCYQFDSPLPTTWTQIPSLLTGRYLSASVSLNNDSYYVIGGEYERRFRKNLYRYSLSERRWYEEPPMAIERAGHSAAALSATEFIVCGDYFRRKACEVYNTIMKKWRTVKSLIVRRKNLALLHFNGRVYALGGYGAGGAKMNVVEVYDEQSGNWTMVKPLKYPRFAFVAVVA